MTNVEAVLSVKNSLGEGPLWVPTQSALYWVDIDNKKVFRYFPRAGRYEEFSFEDAVTVLGIRSRGGFVVGTTHGFAFWNPQPEVEVQTLEQIADPERHKEDNRFNDGAVDPQGRFWAGTMNKKDPFTPTGALYRLDADRSVHTIETDVNIANGCAWSPDNKTMYFTQTGDRTIWKYDFDTDAGTISNRRVFVRIPKEEGFPDGHTIDSEGFLWTAHWGGWRISRFDPDGRKERVVFLPTAQITSLSFGGEDLNELYVTTAYNGLPSKQRHEQALAGAVFRIETYIQGRPEPAFTG